MREREHFLIVTTYGATATQSCTSGYKLTGSVTIQCKENVFIFGIIMQLVF